jgi:hypothetical protein
LLVSICQTTRRYIPDERIWLDMSLMRYVILFAVIDISQELSASVFVGKEWVRYGSG